MAQFELLILFWHHLILTWPYDTVYKTHQCCERIWQTSKMISNISSLNSLTLDGTGWVVEPLWASFLSFLAEPTPPPYLLLLRLQNCIKNTNRAWEGVDTPKLKSRGEPRKEEYLYTGLSPPSSLKRRGKCHIFKSDIFKIEDYA